jgi:hypothetical protein
MELEALRGALMEVMRVQLHGFTEDEIEIVKADLRSDLFMQVLPHLHTAPYLFMQVPSVHTAPSYCPFILRLTCSCSTRSAIRWSMRTLRGSM